MNQDFDAARKDKTFASMFKHKMTDLPSIEDFIVAMDQDEIDASVVMGYGWCEYEIAKIANDFILDAAKKYPERIIPFCSIHPGWGDYAIYEIERCVSLGARGIGELHPTPQAIDLSNDENIASIIDIACQNDMPIVVHGSEPVGHHYPGKGSTIPQQLASFATRFPDALLVFAHWGGGLPFYALMPEVNKILTNVFFDTAATPFLYKKEIFNVMEQIIGAEKILFASDYPLLRAARVKNQVLEAVGTDSAGLIMGENANKLMF